MQHTRSLVVIMIRLFYIAFIILLKTSVQAQEPTYWTTKKLTKYINRQLDRVITYDRNGNQLTFLDMNIDGGDTTEYTLFKYNDNNLLQSYHSKYESGKVDYDFQEFKEIWTIKSKIDGDYSETKLIQLCGDSIISIGETWTEFNISETKQKITRTIYCLGRKSHDKNLYRIVHSSTEFTYNDTLSLYQFKSENKNEIIKVSDDTVIEYKMEYDPKVDRTYKWAHYYLTGVLSQTFYTNEKDKKLNFDSNEYLDKQRLTIIEYEYENF